MSEIHFNAREMMGAEFARMNAGFDEPTAEQGNPVEVPERHGFVITDGDTFVGYASGLACKSALKNPCARTDFDAGFLA